MNVFKVNFIFQYEVCPKNSELGMILSMLQQCTTLEVFKELFDQVVEKYASTEANTPERIQPRNVLLDTLSKYYTCKYMKTHLQATLVQVIQQRSLYCRLIADVAAETITNIEQSSVCNIKQSQQLITCVNVFMEYCQEPVDYEFIIEKVFPLYMSLLKALIAEFEREDKCLCQDTELIQLMCGILKQLLSIFTKTFSKSRSKYSLDFLHISFRLLNNRILGYNIKLTCGLLFAHSLNILPNEEKIHIKYQNYPAVDLVSHLEEEFCIQLKQTKIQNIFRNDAMKILIYSAIFGSIPAEDVREIEFNNRPFPCILFINLIDCGKRMTGGTSEIIEASRIISLSAGHFTMLTPNHFEEVFRFGLDFIWSHLEHSIETVSSNTKGLLTKIVKMAAYHYHQGHENSILLLVQYIKSMLNFSHTRLNALTALSSGMGARFVLDNFNNIQLSLLKAMEDASISTEAVKAYTFMMNNYLPTIQEELFLNIWINPLIEALNNSSGIAYKTYQKVITLAFRMKPSIFRTLCPMEYMGTKNEWETLLKCIQLSRMSSIIIPTTENENSDIFWRGLIQKKKLELFMVHQDEEIRLLALEVIVQCQKSTELITDWEIIYLVSYYSYNISTQIPSSRSRILTLYQKLFARLEAGYRVLIREISSLENYVLNHGEDENVLNVLQEFEHKKKFYRAFIVQFIALLVNDLAPDSNYPRRSSALELLLKLQPIATSSEWKISFTKDDIDNLKNILYDSYESNKLMAVELLQTLSPKSIGFVDAESTRKYFNNCVLLACSLRPSKCLSAAYMFKVCLLSKFSFQNTESDLLNKDNMFNMLVELAKKLKFVFNHKKGDVYAAAQDAPLHGLLLSIRMLIQNRDINKENILYSQLYHELVAECLKIKQVILPIVSNASPEGYLPETETIYELNDSSAKAQMILFYAWRTMKEMTSLLAEIVKQTINLQNIIILLQEEYLINIGEFFIDIFIQSKHRGVFEQAFVGFSVICEKFWNSNNKNINSLPKKWLDQALALCLGQEVDSRLCATRRSAGLPFLILGIISEDISSGRTCLTKTMDQLIIGAGVTKNDASRMHCLNILRVIFRHSKLSNSVSVFVSTGVIATLTGFKCNMWGVRNSATLLYAILINKMFGIAISQDIDHVPLKNKLTLTNFSMRYPDLFNYLLETLAQECKKNNSLLLHPVLYILTRLYPSTFDKNNSNLEKYLPYVNICISNSTYFTRDLAAKASVPLISAELIGGHLLDIFCQLSDTNIKDSECHGMLLQIWHVLKTMNFQTELPISDYLSKSMHLFGGIGQRYSHMTIALYMEIITMLLMMFPGYKDLDMLKQLVLVVSKHRTDQNKLLTCRSTFKWSRLKLLLYIIINKFEHVDVTYDALTHEIMNYLYGSDMEIKKYCLLFLIYLNQVYNDFQYNEQPLFTAGELEVPDTIKELVDSFDTTTQKEFLIYSHQFLVNFLCSELKFKRNDTSDYIVLIFLLLMYYPCIIVNIFGNQEPLDILLKFCDCDNEELTSAILSCVNTLLLKLTPGILKQFNYKRLIEILMQSASPAAADYRRLTVCHLLVSVRILFYGDPILKDQDLYNVFNIVMVLLEDEELEIRNAISEFTAEDCKLMIDAKTATGFETVPDKARADLMASSISLLPNEKAICFLFSWSCRHFPEVSNDVSEIFERGELNLYAENIPIIYSASKVLNRLLWTLGEGLDYQKKSIYLEEQVLLVTSVLVNALSKNQSPMMLPKTKISVISSLRSIIVFLERCQVGNKDFHKNFTTFFNESIVKYLSLSTGSDFSSVKSLFTKLYSCVLKPSTTNTTILT